MNPRFWKARARIHDESDIKRVEEGLAAYSMRLSPEATYYWKCHRPRFRYLSRIVEGLCSTAPISRVLDVGMGFETLLLHALLPKSQIECLGIAPDDRFRPHEGFSFHTLDLNDLIFPENHRSTPEGGFDLIVFMEVLEHLFTPPDIVLRYLASLLVPGGMMIITTPNAAWLKNRLKLICGKNPFEPLRVDRKNMGHVREYTKSELEAACAEAGLQVVEFKRLGLYHFSGKKDRFYSAVADFLHTSLSRTLVAICRKPNKAPEPARPLGTRHRRAGSRLVPSSRVAHL